MKPVLHPRTERAIEKIIAAHPHSLLITGTFGVGKDTVAREIAMQLLEVSDLDKYPYYTLVVAVESKSVTIEQVRAAIDLLKLQTPGRGKVRRIIHFSDADKLTNEGQNALLKTLEEPPSDTVIILTASEPRLLLPTIQSRVQKLLVVSPITTETAKFFSEQGYDEEKLEKALRLSDGMPGFTYALLETPDHPLVQAITQAKVLLTSDVYARLCDVDALIKSDITQLELLWALAKIAQSAQQAAAHKKNREQVAQWQTKRQRIAEVTEMSSRNPSSKLLLTDLALHL
jgi:hypothetical protein